MRWSSILLCLAAYICFAASIPIGDVSKKLTYDSLPNPKYTPGISRTSIPHYFFIFLQENCAHRKILTLRATVIHAKLRTALVTSRRVWSVLLPLTMVRAAYISLHASIHLHLMRSCRAPAPLTHCSRAGVPEEDWSLYEFDHWYPLSIGGCNDERNLWPQVSKFAIFPCSSLKACTVAHRRSSRERCAGEPVVSCNCLLLEMKNLPHNLLYRTL